MTILWKRNNRPVSSQADITETLRQLLLARTPQYTFLRYPGPQVWHFHSADPRHQNCSGYLAVHRTGRATVRGDAYK